MKASENSTRITVSLPHDVVFKIQELAKENQYKVAQLVRKFVLVGLAAAEDEES